MDSHPVCNECGGRGCEKCHNGWECIGEGCNKCEMGWKLGMGWKPGIDDYDAVNVDEVLK